MPDPSPVPRSQDDLNTMAMMIYQALTVLSGFLLVLALAVAGYVLYGDTVRGWFAPRPEPPARPTQAPGASRDIIDGVDQVTGLVVAPGWEVVRGTCTACHSAQLVTQNRASRDGWEQMIRWMQAKQGLWDLGDREDEILDYLAEHYAPQRSGRRPGLDVESIEWYSLP